MAKISYTTDYAATKDSFNTAVSATSIGGTYTWSTVAVGSKVNAGQMTELRSNIDIAWDRINTGCGGYDTGYNSSKVGTYNSTYRSPNRTSTTYSTKNGTINGAKNAYNSYS